MRSGRVLLTKLTFPANRGFDPIARLFDQIATEVEPLGVLRDKPGGTIRTTSTDDHVGQSADVYAQATSDRGSDCGKIERFAFDSACLDDILGECRQAGQPRDDVPDE